MGHGDRPAARDLPRKIGITLPDEPRTFPNARRRSASPCPGDDPGPRRSTRRAPSTAPLTVFAFGLVRRTTSTKRFAPNSTATSATFRVTSALLRTASSGFASIREHVFMYAAAWKTTQAGTSRRPGASSRGCRHRQGRRRSRGKPRSSTVSRSISKRPGSPLSTSTSLVEPRRPGGGNRADRAAGAGDDDDLSGHVPRDRVDVDVDRLAAEEVLHLDRTDLPRQVVVTGDELRGRQVFTGIFSARAISTIRSRALLDADGIAIRGSSGRRSRRWPRNAVVREHPDAVQAEVLLARVVVHQPDRRVPERRVPEHRAGSAGLRPRLRLTTSLPRATIAPADGRSMSVGRGSESR